MPDEDWEAHATWWQAEFTDGADPEYVEQILPLILQHLPLRGSMLDVGAGEGQVARLAAAGGLRASAVDGSWGQVSVGQERGGGVTWARGEATALPYRDESFDAAVACLVIEHVPDLDAAFAEVSRVLRPGGSFLILLNHPLLQTPGSGWIDDHILEEQYWRVGPYLPEAESVDEVDKDVFVRFYHRPLGRYLNSLRDHGFQLERFEEPPPPDGFLVGAPEYQQAATIPRLLFLHVLKM